MHNAFSNDEFKLLRFSSPRGNVHDNHAKYSPLDLSKATEIDKYKPARVLNGILRRPFSLQILRNSSIHLKRSRNWSAKDQGHYVPSSTWHD